MLQLCSVSNSLSHAHIENKLRGIFFKKKLPSSLFIASKCIQRVLCVCIVNHNHGYTTYNELVPKNGTYRHDMVTTGFHGEEERKHKKKR